MDVEAVVVGVELNQVGSFIEGQLGEDGGLVYTTRRVINTVQNDLALDVQSGGQDIVDGVDGQIVDSASGVQLARGLGMVARDVIPAQL